MSLRPATLLGVAVVAAACGAAPTRPLPGGPPPEYEPPRAFDAPHSDRAAPAPPAAPPASEPPAAPPAP